MFKRVLVANRGEIAKRIISTLNKMGIQSIAVYSQADKDFSYLKEAHQAICIGPPRSLESYVCEDAVLEAARQSDAEAIHPGFGFLSENASFAKRCALQKLTFIGPHPNLISMMGDKNQARITMHNMGVPILPGSLIINNFEEAISIAKNIGYPVLLKAKAGGGGKGMRLVTDQENMKDAFLSAQAESLSSFKDDSLYMEKFLESARHIEFQVLGDNFGTIICLGNRECSIQRNNQKLIEEAPANINEEQNQFIQTSIKNALQKLKYTNAGTMEFLLAKSGELYFMEMNTRLQVEHPVTEFIYGLDIVEWQVRIAANQKLDLNKINLKPHGHAIECRINAEDPKNYFTPKSGEINNLTWPKLSSEIRLDTHIEKGSYISPFYDSMLAKLIVYGKTRQEAVKLMQNALKNTLINGPTTTVEFHRQILANKQFITGNYDCSFIRKNLNSLLEY